MKSDLANSVATLVSSLNPKASGLSELQTGTVVASKQGDQQDSIKIAELMQSLQEVTVERDELRIRLEQERAPASPTALVMLNKKMPGSKADALKEIKQLRELVSTREQEIAELNLALESMRGGVAESPRGSLDATTSPYRYTEDNTAGSKPQLAESLENALATIDAMTTGFATSQQEVIELRDTLSHAENERLSLQSSVAELTEKLSFSRQRLESLMTENEASQESVVDLESRLQRSEDEVAALGSVQTELNELKEQHGRLEQELERSRLEVQALVSKHELAMQSHNANVSESTAELEAEVSRITLSLDQARAELAAAQQNADEAASKANREISDANEAWQSKLEECLERLRQVEGERDSALAEMRSLEAALKASQEDQASVRASQEQDIEAANMQISGLKEELRRQTEETKTLSSELTAAQSKLAEAEAAMSQLRSSTEMEQSKHSSINVELDELRSKAAASAQQVEQLQAELARVHRALSDAESVHAERNDMKDRELELLRQEFDDYRNESEDVKRQQSLRIEELEVSVDELTEESRKLAEMNKASALENQQAMEQEAIRTQGLLDVLRDEMQALQQELSDAESAKTRLTAELADLKSSRKELERELTVQRDACAEVRDSYDVLKTQLESLQQSQSTQQNLNSDLLNQETAKATALQVQLSALQQELGQHQHTIDQLRTTLDEKLSTIDDLQRQLNEESRTAGNLENSLQTSYMEIADLRDSAKVIASELQDLKASMQHRDTQVETLKNEKIQLESDKSALKQNFDALMEEYEFNKAELAEIRVALRNKELALDQLTSKVDSLSRIETELKQRLEAEAEIVRRATAAEEALGKQDEKKKRDLETLKKLNEKISSQQRELNTCEAKHAQTMQELRNEVAALTTKLAAQAESLDQCNSLLDSKTSELDQASRAMTHSAETIRSLERQLVELKSNRSPSAPGSPEKPFGRTNQAPEPVQEPSHLVNAAGADDAADSKLHLLNEEIQRLKTLISESETYRVQWEERAKQAEASVSRQDSGVRSELDSLRAQLLQSLARTAELEEERKRLELEAHEAKMNTGAAATFNQLVTPSSKQRQVRFYYYSVIFSMWSVCSSVHCEQKQDRDLEAGDRQGFGYDEKKDVSGTWPPLVTCWSYIK
jgi:chromosome segregation ATPase